MRSAQRGPPIGFDIFSSIHGSATERGQTPVQPVSLRREGGGRARGTPADVGLAACQRDLTSRRKPQQSDHIVSEGSRRSRASAAHPEFFSLARTRAWLSLTPVDPVIQLAGDGGEAEAADFVMLPRS